MSQIRLWFKDSAIRDEAEFLCLTDMWRAAGGDPSKRPSKWFETERFKEFSDFIAGNLGVSNTDTVRAQSGGAGGSGATWAHWQLGLAYAQYLSPEFHAWCNDVVRKVMRGDVADPGALAGVLGALESLATRLSRLESNQAALWTNVSLGGYIARGRFESLKAEWNSLITVEVAIGRWPSRAAARRDIMNELHEVTQWGGKCKPWNELPAALEPSARAVLKRRMKDAERRSPPRQLSLIKNA